MARQHRMRPPRNEPWESINTNPGEPAHWLVGKEDWPVQVKDNIPSRLKNALIGAKTVRLLRSTLAEWDDKNEWRCWRLLGAGAHGVAALWNLTNVKGTLLDEIVVKESNGSGRKVQHRGELVPMKTEAFWQNFVNQRRSDNVVHLRGYRAIMTDYDNLPNLDPLWQDDKVSEIDRFYLEYAPYGDLQSLAVKYKAFNRYLPELFLWHLFNSLARAILELESIDGFPDRYLFHADIKPANIFLGYEGTRSRDPNVTGGLDGETVNYPSIKLGDFGLALWAPKVGWSAQLGHIGTGGYQPPETEQYPEYYPPGCRYAADWIPSANRTDTRTPKANVWAIGKVMYDIFSLSEQHLYDQLRAKNREQYDLFNQQPIPEYASTPFLYDRVQQSSPYTKELSDLIERCMRIEAEGRPSAAELETITRIVMQNRHADGASVSPFTVRGRKLYYKGNEINNMSADEKNCFQSISPDDYFMLLNPASNDPDDPQLDIYPEQTWEFQTDPDRKRFNQAWFREAREDEARECEFRDHILKDDLRVNLDFNGPEIKFRDMKKATRSRIHRRIDQLTYNGLWTDYAYIDDVRDKELLREMARNLTDGHEDGSDDDDDEGDVDDNDADNDDDSKKDYIPFPKRRGPTRSNQKTAQDPLPSKNSTKRARSHSAHEEGSEGESRARKLPRLSQVQQTVRPNVGS